MISSIEIDSLFERYPNLFKEFWGSFIVGQGWMSIIKDMCITLQYLNRVKDEKISLLDVRNKFGVLHIDYKGNNFYSKKVINFAERLSYNTCEECGKKGKLFTSDGTQYGKFVTLCNKDALLKYKPYELSRDYKVNIYA